MIRVKNISFQEPEKLSTSNCDFDFEDPGKFEVFDFQMQSFCPQNSSYKIEYFFKVIILKA